MNAVSIFKGLNSPLSAERISVTRAIRQRPARAEKACTEAGRDLIGRLLELCIQFSNSSEKWEHVFTALSFADQRTAELAKEIFVASVESHYLVMAANRISLLTDIEKAAFLSPILLADNNNNRTRLCANLLAGNRQISTNVAIRICAIADKKCDLPPFNKETVNSWIAEMQGPYTQSIRKKFLTLRDRPVNLLLTDWETLSDSLKEWVLIKLIKDSPSGYEVLLTTILQRETSVTVLSCALSCIQNSSNTDVFNDVISILLKHENEKLRAQAVFCYQEDTALLGILDNEKSPVVIANILLKISTDHELIPLISGYFSHPQWQVRAAAAQSFVNLAPESIKTLKELFYSDDLNVRTSAIRCLNELKMEQWIKENLSAIQ